MFVKQWMTADPKFINPKTPVMEAMQILRAGGFRRLPVVSDDKLVGIVTDRDLKEATPSKATTLSVYELNYLLSKLTVNDIMKTDVYLVSPHDPLEKAALIMEEEKISGLPVTDNETLVGIITITDILKAFVQMLGLREGGVRITAMLPDQPGILAQVASAAAPSNISTVVTSGIQEGQARELTLRVTGQDAQGFAERLRKEGVEVTDIQ